MMKPLWKTKTNNTLARAIAELNRALDEIRHGAGSGEHKREIADPEVRKASEAIRDARNALMPIAL